MSTKIVISGVTGRMGQALQRLLAGDARFQLVGGIATARSAQPLRIETIGNAGDLISAADVVIDFSSVAAVGELLDQRRGELRGKALVVGTTGIHELRQQLFDVSDQTAILVAANFSVGVNLLLALVEAAARVLPPDQYDVEIVEAHHRRKLDAPSGTALALGEMIARGRAQPLESLRKEGRSGQTGVRPAGEIGFHALRGGDIVGEHRVHFIGARERIELAHSAQDRTLFAEGALRAAQWMAGKPPGEYGMLDVLGLRSLP